MSMSSYNEGKLAAMIRSGKVAEVEKLRGERTEWIMDEYCMSDASQESLVVCRLRRNGNFWLTESSKGSNDLRNLSTTDNGHYSGANEIADTQRDGSDKGSHMKSCSKDSTSNYGSDKGSYIGLKRPLVAKFNTLEAKNTWSKDQGVKIGGQGLLGVVEKKVVRLFGVFVATTRTRRTRR
ncbi:NAC domain-containing protein [Tanacetum coccineum]